ncbi:hypothetical protein CSW20_06515, partial [Thermus scotoductus]
MSSAPSSWTLRRKPSFAKDLKRHDKSLYKSDRQREEFLKGLFPFVEILERPGPSSPLLDTAVMTGGLAQEGHTIT